MSAGLGPGSVGSSQEPETMGSGLELGALCTICHWAGLEPGPLMAGLALGHSEPCARVHCTVVFQFRLPCLCRGNCYAAQVRGKGLGTVGQSHHLHSAVLSSALCLLSTLGFTSVLPSPI